MPAMPLTAESLAVDPWNQISTESVQDAANKVSTYLAEWKESLIASVISEDPSLTPNNVSLFIKQTESSDDHGNRQIRFDLEVIRESDQATIARSARFVNINAIYDQGRRPEDHIMEMVSVDELKRLRERSDWLDCLEAAGVDNWSGIDQAHEIKEGEF